MMSCSENGVSLTWGGVPRRLATVHAWRPRLLPLRLLLRLWDVGRIEMHIWRLKQRYWGSNTISCLNIVGYENSMTIISRSQTVAFCTRVWICKSTIRSNWLWASNSTSTVLGYRSMTVGNAEHAHKASKWDKRALEIHKVVRPGLSTASYMS